MSSPYIGEIRLFAGNFAPLDWAFCDGSILSIANNDTLFNLIGTTYGGDGVQTFALPDLRGRIPVHFGTSLEGASYQVGQNGGSESVTLTGQQMPIHSHVATCRAGGSESPDPTGRFWGASSDNQYAGSSTNNTNMNAGVFGLTGGNQPHNNVMPYLSVCFIISLFGIYPSQS